MVGELLLGLDLGSSQVRALVVDPDGGVRGRAAVPVVAAFPAPGRVEHDPEHLVCASVDVLREALARAGAVARDIAGLGIATQRSTALAWDAASGAPLAPAVSWQDQRGAEIADVLKERGLPPVLQATLPKLAWWLEREPAVRSAAADGRLRVGTPDVWLAQRLAGGGPAVTDPGQASCTGLFDLTAGAWSTLMLERLGLPAEVLPEVVATAGIAGETRAEVLGAPVPLAARAGDQQAAAFAQGLHAKGDANLTLGTGAILDVHSGPDPDFHGEGFPLALWLLPDGSRAFCREGHVTTAGAALEWFVALGLFPDAEALERAACEAAGSDGVVFVPALQGLATPWYDAGARGFIGGLTRGSGRPQLAYALLEGIAQRCADVCDALVPEGSALGERPLRVDGGLARSDLLLQRLADLTDRPVERAAEREASALGAALLAGLGAGSFADAPACQALRGPPERFTPSADRGEVTRARASWLRVVQRRVLDADG